MCVVLASSNTPSTSETESLHVSGDWILEEVAGIGNPGGAWSPRLGDRTSIAVDSMGMPHIAYRNLETKEINYSYKDTTGKWHTETVVRSDTGGLGVALALDLNDRPLICYQNLTMPTGMQGLSCAFSEGSGWRHETVDSTPYAGSHISLALDSFDRPHLAYYVANVADTKYAWYNGTSWNISVLRDRVVSTTDSLAMDLDQNNSPHVALLSMGGGSELGLWFYRLNGTKWDKEVVDSTHSRTIFSMALNDTDSPHLGTVRPIWNVPIHMYKDGGSWRTEYADLGADVGYGSFSLDSSGQPHFAYRERNGEDLRYAHKENGTWKNVTVDSEGRVGFLPSLAMDLDNIPHISYIDLTDNLLMYATKKKQIKARIDIDPDTLNLRSRGKWVTCYIELPAEYDPRDINASTILLNNTLRPELDPKYGFVRSEESYIVDHDGNGIYERMVKFGRQKVIDMLGQGGLAELTVVGHMNDGTQFEGSDTINVMDRPLPVQTVFSAVDGLTQFSPWQHSTSDGTLSSYLRHSQPWLEISAEFAASENRFKS
ncbi:MAG: hypothetical protein KAR39_04370 [Thermoplasmata archaeon]|nr:hypothetical protein [Thermoplasmata archaeon]